MSGPPLPAALHPEQVHPVDRGVLPGRSNADKLALVGAAVGHAGGHQRPLSDHVVDLDAYVGKGLEQHPNELLGLLGVLAAEGVIKLIGVTSSSMASRFRPLRTSW